MSTLQALPVVAAVNQGESSVIVPIDTKKGTGTPKFNLGLKDASKKVIEFKAPPGTVFTVDLVATNLDKDRSISLNFTSSGRNADKSKPMPAEWMSYNINSVKLKPTDSSTTTITISIPATAEDGLYAGLASAVLKDHSGINSSDSGVGINIAQGVKVFVDVAKSYEKVVEKEPAPVVPSTQGSDINTWLMYGGIGVLLAVLLIGVIQILKKDKNRK